MNVIPQNLNHLLKLEDVNMMYDGKIILDDIDLRVSKGEFCTVVGPSGCGKSTLLRLILGQEQPSDGILLVNGRTIDHPDPERGIVYQHYSLLPNLTVIQNVMKGLNLTSGFFERRRRRTEFLDRVMHFLQKVKLQDHGDKLPHQLSGGQRQRVAIAQALIMNPKILLMDEPYGALDPGTREEMQVFILELWEEFKMTIFFVTHDLEEAVFLGSRILVLSQYFTDGRGEGCNHRGARIVADHPIRRHARSTNIKELAEFGELIQQIRREGFDPSYIQHVTKFNLNHLDSFRTLSEDELQEV